MSRRTLCLLVALAVCGLGGSWLYVRVTDRSRVIDALISAGGKYEAPRPSFFDALFAKLSGNRPRGESVVLQGPQFDDEWLAAQKDLRQFDIRELFILDTRLSHSAVLRLINQNSLDYLAALGVPLTDADAAVLGGQEHLTRLILMRSELTDAGLAALQPQRLQVLNVAGTPVTAAALKKELMGGQLLHLAVDGHQFTPELAAQIAQMRTLTMIALYGPDVTDAHVKLLEAMPNIRYFRIDQTSVSEDAVAALRAARPAPVVIDVAPPAEVFFKWRTDQPAAAP